MSQLYVRQHFFNLGGRFDVTDFEGKVCYTVTGSLLKVPKTFQIFDPAGHEIAKVVHRPFSFLATFDVEMNGAVVATIKKKLSFLRDQYDIDSGAVDVEGSWTGLHFTVSAQGRPIAKIHEDAFSFGHAYELDIDNEDYEGLIVALVLAIDYARSESGSTS
ncbi:LURP-one-related/scramblase family protein [Schleiferilactobacillus shenzhenensis]|uniref:YxjI n=1 Tax=Schleiferilactobacillus shenzhenensis LY-73 TaxID=1231336 RepID=U4TW56_9LACO|nr:LURP-one-related family protein [Schleiferilactobacillus shenzhenensis]ERL66073.1 hypothetical protein L248_1165 [Schleiferilactobacillus shenzhenensis LY-73]